MAIIGYARVSSLGQSLDIQIDKLKDCDKIFQEKRSGIDNTRSELKNALEYIREGDVLVVTRLDRLARSTAHLCKIAETLVQKSVALKVLDQNIDTKDATGRLLFNKGPVEEDPKVSFYIFKSFSIRFYVTFLLMNQSFFLNLL